MLHTVHEADRKRAAIPQIWDTKLGRISTAAPCPEPHGIAAWHDFLGRSQAPQSACNSLWESRATAQKTKLTSVQETAQPSCRPQTVRKGAAWALVDPIRCHRTVRLLGQHAPFRSAFALYTHSGGDTTDAAPPIYLGQGVACCRCVRRRISSHGTAGVPGTSLGPRGKVEALQIAHAAALIDCRVYLYGRSLAPPDRSTVEGCNGLAACGGCTLCNWVGICWVQALWHLIMVEDQRPPCTKY